jgi:hypothetical protein
MIDVRFRAANLDRRLSARGRTRTIPEPARSRVEPAQTGWSG